MKVLVVDNYDSFTFNLVNILRKSKHLSYEVIKSGEIKMEAVAGFDKILFSPGPDVPKENDTMWQILQKYGNCKSILGVCLGFQAIGIFYGARLINLQDVFHGKKIQVEIVEPNERIFQGIKSPFEAGLYHSWGLSDEGFPVDLKVTARSLDGRIMALSHRNYDIRGVQFHPESVMTTEGEKMIHNWLWE